MSLLFDATADALSRTTDLLSNSAAYTLMGWVYLVSDTNVAGVIFALTNSAGTVIDAILLDADGTTLANYCDGPGLASGTLATGTWTHLTMRRTTTSNLDLMTNGVVTTSNTTAAGAGRAQDAMYIGSFGGIANGANIRVAGMKAWSTNLTDVEVLNEMRVLQARRSTNLYGCWPMIHAAVGDADNDYSGNGRNWGSTGVTVVDGPPVGWGGSPAIYPFRGATLNLLGQAVL